MCKRPGFFNVFALFFVILVSCCSGNDDLLNRKLWEVKSSDCEQQVITINAFQEIVRRENWLLIQSPVKQHDIVLANRNGKERRLKFDWIVLHMDKWQIYRTNDRYQFECLFDKKLIQTNDYTLFDGDTMHFEVWRNPSLIIPHSSLKLKKVSKISSPALFKTFGNVSANSDDQVLVVLLQERLCEIEDGSVTNLWYTPRITNVRFVRKELK
jgi:hypothetical protein